MIVRGMAANCGDSPTKTSQLPAESREYQRFGRREHIPCGDTSYRIQSTDRRAQQVDVHAQAGR